MRHGRAFRAVAGLISVWLGICLAEPMQLHLCVMHGGLAIESASHSASHASHSAATHAAHHPTNGHDKSQQCSCLGDCTAGSSPTFLPSTYFRVDLPSSGRAVATSLTKSAEIATADFVLPFPNGPPGTSSLA